MSINLPAKLFCVGIVRVIPLHDDFGGDGGESLSQKDLATTNRVDWRCITAIFAAKAAVMEILVPMFTRFVYAFGF